MGSTWIQFRLEVNTGSGSRTIRNAEILVFKEKIQLTPNFFMIM
jgi:hypothetical protein